MPYMMCDPIWRVVTFFAHEYVSPNHLPTLIIMQSDHSSLKHQNGNFYPQSDARAPVQLLKL